MHQHKNAKNKPYPYNSETFLPFHASKCLAFGKKENEKETDGFKHHKKKQNKQLSKKRHVKKISNNQKKNFPRNKRKDFFLRFKRRNPAENYKNKQDILCFFLMKEKKKEKKEGAKFGV
ncbi:hypothetical protein RFI_03595 [Reticulomyxa filosa]|uniref:Uncharacterized protein n=1 Tax=Reticulomyxa filosa TaxID=46433 RepID=X6P791_RETFI|nr:hypothetical protein RFI_03595 [Reticulomyxa filosa]|eukprot:ETO33507.1 hypothetical protein RFI_03595 [Reticulomyxa filosa]